MTIDFKYLECACYSPCHTLRIWADDEDELVMVEVHLTQLPWYERLWVAVKYVFGTTNKLHSFEETMLNKEQQKILKELLYV